jgi:hypothetical protein
MLTTTLEQKIIELEEKLAYAELARDNAITLREEVQVRAKNQRKNIGRMISEMRELVKTLCQEVDEPTRRWANGRMNEILNKPKDSDDSGKAAV